MLMHYFPWTAATSSYSDASAFCVSPVPWGACAWIPGNLASHAPYGALEGYPRRVAPLAHAAPQVRLVYLPHPLPRRWGAARRRACAAPAFLCYSQPFPPAGPPAALSRQPHSSHAPAPLLHALVARRARPRATLAPTPRSCGGRSYTSASFTHRFCRIDGGRNQGHPASSLLYTSN